MLFAYFIISLSLILLLYQAIKHNTDRVWNCLHITSLIAIFFTAIRCSLVDDTATENVYMADRNLDFDALFIFFVFTMLTVIARQFMDIYKSFGDNIVWWKKLIIAMICILGSIIACFLFPEIVEISLIIGKAMEYIGVFLAIVLVIFFSIMFVNIEIKQRKSNSIYNTLLKLKEKTVRDKRCVYCGELIKNTKLKCSYCGQKQIYGLKVIVFNIDEILLLCKMIENKKENASYVIEMKKLLESIRQNRIKIVLIGTGVKRRDIKRIEKSQVNKYIDEKFFNRCKSIKSDEKIFECVIKNMCIRENEMLFVGNLIDGKVFVAKEKGIYSICLQRAEISQINIKQIMNLKLYSVVDEFRHPMEISRFLFEDKWKIT